MVPSTRWWPTGWPWERWRLGRQLEQRREEWAATFFATEVASRPQLFERCELKPPPDLLRLDAVAASELLGAWLAVKVCARRLPTDPIGAGLDALRDLTKYGSQLRAEVDHLRPIADDRAPDGGGWFPWIVSHSEYEMDSSEAAQRDLRQGGASVLVELVDNAVSGLSKSLRRTRRAAGLVSFLPLIALASVLAAVGSLFDFPLWLAVLVGVTTFLIVDWIFVRLVVEPFIEDRRRRLLDEAADRLEEVALAAVVAGVGRRSRL